MTVSNTTRRTAGVVGEGVEQTINFTFPISDTSDIVVKTRLTATGAETTLTETTHYTVTITDTGGSITTVTPFIASNSTIHIYSNTPIEQELDLTQGGSFNAENLEDSFDKLTKIAQEIDQKTDRMLMFPETDPVTSISTLPSSISRAEKYLYFDSDGKPSVLAGVVDTSEVHVSAFMATVLDDANGAAVHATLGLLDEDAMTSNSATLPASQQSIKAYIDSGAVTMTNKTLTAPTITSPSITGTTTIANGATLTTPILTSPVINVGVSGTAILDEDDMDSDSDTQLATQQSIKAYVDATVAARSGYTDYSSGIGTTIYNNKVTKADTWQTLDLTDILGAVDALLFIQVSSAYASYHRFAVRQWQSDDGNAAEGHYPKVYAYDASGCSSAAFYGTCHYFFTVPAKEGKIQIADSSDAATAVLTIRLRGYVK